MKPVNSLYPDNDRYFFSGGLRFSCVQCGACCKGAPGIVRVTQKEIEAIAEYLRCSAEEAAETFCRKTGSGHALKEHADGRCIFFENTCTVYHVRPGQCRTFPFWVKNLRNEQAWKKASDGCPGIGTGAFFTFEEIIRMMDFSVS